MHVSKSCPKKDWRQQGNIEMHEQLTTHGFMIDPMNRSNCCAKCTISKKTPRNRQRKRKFLEDDEYPFLEEYSHALNGNFIYELIRRKAHGIVKHNKLLSKDRIKTDDAMSLVLILFQSGNLDLHSEPEEFQDHFCFEVDETTKKVNQLLVSNTSRTYDAPLQFPIDAIASLDQLKVLKLSNINVTSPHILHEKRTTSLLLQRRSLCNLKKLDISYSKMRDEGAVLKTQFFHLLPKLECVTFRLFTGRTETRYLRSVLDDLRSSFCACRNTLTSIDLSYSMCTQDELSVLLVDVVPKLPNLVHINMSGNKIQSFQRIAERIQKTRATTDSRSQCCHSLQILDLSWNTVMTKIMNNAKEKAALMTILGAYKGLYNIGNNINIKEYPSDMRYQLSMNHAGRRLTETHCLCNKTIPTSLLPHVLERAFERSRDIYPLYWRDERKKDPTGLYSLFRSGPILHSFIQERLADKNRDIPHGRNDAGESRKHKRRRIDPPQKK